MPERSSTALEQKQVREGRSTVVSETVFLILVSQECCQNLFMYRQQGKAGGCAEFGLYHEVGPISMNRQHRSQAFLRAWKVHTV